VAITLEALAVPSPATSASTSRVDRQGTFSSSQFPDACRSYNGMVLIIV
jgi:hypothetical protein